MVKYAVYPGYTTSRDGDVHYIDARQLMRLYRVDPKECVVVDYDYETGWSSLGVDLEPLRPLYVSHVGGYIPVSS